MADQINWSIISTPNDWYWYYGDGSGSTVYSSRLGNYVSVDDADYLVWLQTNSPTQITDRNTLAKTILHIGAPIPNDADVYASYKQAQLDRMSRAVIYLLLNHENRLRAMNSPPDAPFTLLEYYDEIVANVTIGQ